MADLTFEWYVEDIPHFIKAIEILGNKDGRIPLLINPTGVYSTVDLPARKKQKKNDTEDSIIVHAYFPRCNLPQFGVYAVEENAGKKKGKKKRGSERNTSEINETSDNGRDGHQGHHVHDMKNSKRQLVTGKEHVIRIGLDKSKVVAKMGSLKPKDTVHFYTKVKEDDHIYYSVNESSEEQFKQIVDLNKDEVKLPNIKIPKHHPNVSLTKEGFQKLCANIKRHKDCDWKILISTHGLVFEATEYGSNESSKFPEGISGEEIDTMAIDPESFMISTGKIDKMCNLKSIIKMYAQRDENGNGYLMISLPIGNSGVLDIYCPETKD